MNGKVEGNKEMDFKILERAATATVDKLKADETNTDLFDQFQYRPDIAGSHRYFIEPYKSAWGSLVEQFDFIPLPQIILEQYSTVECASFMGILPEINRVWVTVDNKLYIWNYYNPEECQIFDSIAEVIISVSLAAPKPGVFMDTVKYVLIVASPIEVAILAVSFDNDRRNLRLIPTLYKLPSDNVTMVKITGAQNGRIFMAGNDGNLYELDYTNANKSWASAVGLEPPHKCRKINRFALHWKLLLPPLLRAFTGASEDGLAELTVDNVRNVLYLSSTKGVLSVFYLGPSGDESHFIVPSFQLFQECRSFLSNGRNTPNSSPDAECFKSASTTTGFVVIALHVIPLIESRKAHLVVVLANGIRIYLSLRSDYGGLYTRVGTSTTPAPSPSGLEIAYIRSPPSLNAIKHSNVVQQTVEHMNDSTARELENGSVPSFTPAQSLMYSNVLCSHGTVLMSIDREKLPDQLLCLYEDHTYRTEGSQPVSQYQPPCLKEGISLVLDGTNSAGKIHDIKEDTTLIHCKEAAQLLSLYAHSATPGSVGVDSHHFQQSGRPVSNNLNAGGEDDTYTSADFPVSHSAALAAAASQQTTIQGLLGYDRADLDQVTILSEMTYQSIPSNKFTLQRQFLVLTSQGLHVFKKVRPIDLLYRNLAQLHTTNSDQLTRYFFNAFNPLQASAMCVSLSCTAPIDAGGAGQLDPILGPYCTKDLSIETLQKRAMSVLFALTTGPTHRDILNRPALTNGITGTAGDVQIQRDVSSLINDASGFMYSVAHEALYLTFGRLVRPVWLRSILHDGTVDEMWTISLITLVRAPLLQFLNVLKGYFPVAVMTDPNKVDFLQTLDKNPSEHLITGQLHSRAKASVNVDQVLQQQAKNREDNSLNALYRLASRTCHALSLLEILLTMTQQYNIRFDWGVIGEISFRTLVISPTVHDRIKKVINALISEVSVSDKTQMADRVIDWLSNECYHFFSAGDRYVYEASKLLDALKKLLMGDQATNGTVFSQSVAREGGVKRDEIQSLSSNCVQLLCSAAKYWHTLESVGAGSDEVLNSKCSQLLELNSDIGRDGVVDLCLLVAENFRVKTSSSSGITNRAFSSRVFSDVAAVAPDAVAVLDNTSFDSGFYHGGGVLNDADRVLGIKSCYTCLIQHIVAAGRDIPHLGEGMVSPQTVGPFDPLVLAMRSMQSMILRAVTKCNDDLFHDMLYATLFRENKDQLFLVRTSQVERYLNETDPVTLYCYYEYHKEHTKAANLMSTLAHVTEDLDIEIRIAHLQKAVASAEKSATLNAHKGHKFREVPYGELMIENGESTGNAPHNRIVISEVGELQDTLYISGFQKIAYKKLLEDFNGYHFTAATRNRFDGAHAKQLEQMERQVHRLRYQLVGITELFCECMLYRLWDVCLLLVKISKHNDQDLIARLWRSFIYRIVPDNGNSSDVQSFLRLKREPNRIDIDHRLQRSDVAFEDINQWVYILEKEVTALGLALTAEASSAFPVITVLDELEEIAGMLEQTQSLASVSFSAKGWAYRCFSSMGFSPVIMMESYIELFKLWAGKVPQKMVQIMGSATSVMLTWSKKAIEHDSTSAGDTRLLIQYARSGVVRAWLEKIRSHISTMASRGLSTADKTMLEAINRQLHEVNSRVNELAFV